ncbi:hypothetical protein GCM10010207_06780 [Streptomyces atratus]|nr:hypothetical protein GCM10010207_06780 [Streptomyces atratus]
MGKALAALRRCAAHPAQVQSPAGTYSSKAGTVMRLPSVLVKIFGRICTGASVSTLLTYRILTDRREKTTIRQAVMDGKWSGAHLTFR